MVYYMKTKLHLHRWVRHIKTINGIQQMTKCAYSQQIK